MTGPANFSDWLFDLTAALNLVDAKHVIEKDSKTPIDPLLASCCYNLMIRSMSASQLQLIRNVQMCPRMLFRFLSQKYFSESESQRHIETKRWRSTQLTNLKKFDLYAAHVRSGAERLKLLGDTTISEAEVKRVLFAGLQDKEGYSGFANVISLLFATRVDDFDTCVSTIRETLLRSPEQFALPQSTKHAFTDCAYAIEERRGTTKPRRNVANSDSAKPAKDCFFFSSSSHCESA